MANMMRCAQITGPGQPLKFTGCSLPAVPPGGALVKTTHAGVCHSDVHYINNRINLGGGKILQHSSLYDGFVGSVPGHEISGIIQEFGKDVDPSSHDFAVGDKVVVYPFIGCLQCGPCKAGYNNMCDDNRGTTTDIGRSIPGGYGTHVPVPQMRFLVKVPESMPMDLACLIPCSASTSYEALLRVKDQLQYAHTVRPENPARLLLVGAGGLGLWGVQLARLVIPDVPLHVTVADVEEEKLETAREVGANAGVVWSRDATTEDCIKNAISDGKFDAAIDFVGLPKTAEASVACVNKGGAVVFIGLGGGEMSLSIPRTIAAGLTIQGSRVMPVATLAKLITLVEGNEIKYGPVEHVTLEALNDVIDRMRLGKLRGRAVICYDN